MPFPALEVFSAISAACKLAWVIYDKGFRPGLQYDQDYVQLVHSVRDFHTALRNIEDVHARAWQVVERQHVENTLATEQSLSSFKSIVGDFDATLQDCRRLLEEKERYARSHAQVVAGVRWNLTVVDEVRELRGRIIFHHIRMSQMLEPIKMTLLLSLEEAMQRGFRSVLSELAQIKEFLGIPGDPVPSAAESSHEIPTVPSYLRGRFDNQADADRDLPVSDEIRISSVMGHLDETSKSEGGVISASRTSVVQRYVDLMKAAWIFGRHADLANNAHDTRSSLNAVTWRDVKSRVIAGLNAFDETTGNFRKPSDDEIGSCPDIKFTLWIFQPGSRPLKPKFERLTEILLLEVPLESTAQTETQQLTVASAIAKPNSLRIVTSFSDAVGRTHDTDTHNLSTNSAVLLPTYAQPGAELFNVQIKPSAHAQQEPTYQFRKVADLHKFQRCLTGFEVKHDQPGITELKYKHSGLFAARRMRTLSLKCDVVRAQIWVHNPMRTSLKSPLNSPSTPSETLSPLSAHRRDGSSQSRRRSQVSGRSQTQSIDEWAEINAPSSYAPVTRAPNATAQEIPMPEESKVVLLLAILDQSDTSTSLPVRVKTRQYFTFSLRDGVYIDRSSCQCHRDEDCPVLVIKSRGSLTARLYDHSHDLHNWNLAALGQLGHEAADRSCQDIEGLNRIIITFRDAAERFEFGNKVDSARDLYEKHRYDYEKTVRKVQQQDIIR